MARSVISATRSFTPAKSASSSMHSTGIMVLSMSAISIRFSRPSASTKFRSHPSGAVAVPAWVQAISTAQSDRRLG